jgi:hypothetical protein
LIFDLLIKYRNIEKIKVAVTRGTVSESKPPHKDNTRQNIGIMGKIVEASFGPRRMMAACIKKRGAILPVIAAKMIR